MKETNASLLYECNCQCYILRFEERAKEFILMAKVNFIKGNHSESNERAIIIMRRNVYKCVESLG